ncbi:glycosyltransferase family 2 protein [candidate division KSB1 bacterium]
MIDISCIIVTYNNEETITECLRSIERDISGYTAEILLIDNASADRTVITVRAAVSPGIGFRVIENRDNLGFARAVNQGIAASRGEYILLLNPDTVIHAGFFKAMLTHLQQNSGTGIAAPRHVTPSGEILASCREFPGHMSVLSFMSGLSMLFPKSRIFNRWKMGYFDYESSGEVPQPMGACIMTRRSDIDTIGYMDERFWMFFNDVDWCLRYRNAGKKSYYLSHAKITHYGGYSVKKHRKRMIVSSHYAFIFYFFKHYRGYRWLLPNIVVSAALILAGGVRILLYMANAMPFGTAGAVK